MPKGKHQKEQELAVKIIEGARALYELFERLKTDRNQLKKDFIEELAEKHGLTLNQRRYLDNVGLRATRAQAIVRYLEQKFGADENLNFSEPEELFKFLFKGTYCPQNLKAHSDNIGIGFEKQKWQHNGIIGRAEGFNYDQLASPLDQTISRLEKNKLTNCAALCYLLPAKEYLSKDQRTLEDFVGPILTAEEKLLRIIFGKPLLKMSIEEAAEKVQKLIKEHELRHVIDKIINSPRGYAETSADMYAEKSLDGLDRDIRNKYEWLKERQEDNEKAIAIRKGKSSESRGYTPELDKLRERRAKYQGFEKNLKTNFDACYKMLESAPKEDYPVLSYFISALPSPLTRDISYRFNALRSHYRNKEKK